MKETLSVPRGTISDSFVVGSRRTPAALAALLALVVVPACSRPAPVDPSSVRGETTEAEAESDTDGADQAVVATSTSEPLTWIASEQEAAAKSKAERRPMLVHFSTEWCADCKRMVAETFGDDRVKTQAGRFVAVRIEATNDEDPQVGAALSKYAVINVPTLIVLDSSGREQRRFTEFVPAATLLSQIRQVQ